MQILAITPDQFDPDIHSLPTAGKLLLPGMEVVIDTDGIVQPIEQAVIDTPAHGTVIELCKVGEFVEVAVTGEQQSDGGFYFEQFWVVIES